MTDHRELFNMTPTQVVGFAIFLLATGLVLVILGLVGLVTGAVSGTGGVFALLQGGGGSAWGAYLLLDARRRRRADP